MRMTSKLREDYTIWLEQGIHIAHKSNLFTDEEWKWLQNNKEWIFKKLCDAPPAVREKYTYANVAEKISKLRTREMRQIEGLRSWDVYFGIGR